MRFPHRPKLRLGRKSSYLLRSLPLRRFIKPSSSLLFLAATLTLTGCLATQRDVLEVHSSIDRLNSTLTAMQRNQADLSIKMDELSMNLGKIQTLRLEQGIVMRWMDRYHLTARQARSSHKQDNRKNFTVPIVSAELANHLRELLLSPEGDDLMQIPTSERFKPISPYYMRSRILFLGLLPSLAATIAAWQIAGPISLLLLLWLPAVILLTYRNWRRGGYHCSADGFVRRSGLVGYRSVALLYRKVQRVTVTQSRYQRGKGLASLRVYMASGSVRIPYIGHAEAKRLRDYILYEVESSQQAWH